MNIEAINVFNRGCARSSFWHTKSGWAIGANQLSSVPVSKSLPFAHSVFCGSTISVQAACKRELVFDKSVSRHQVY